jgi:uncharacterized protein YlxW (UPF0749 family)
MSAWPDVLTAVLAAISGGGLLKFAETWLSRSKQKSEQDKQFRDELRQEAAYLREQIKGLKDELKTAEKELDDFKEKYWKVYTEYKHFRLEVYSILLKNGIQPDAVLPPESKDA